MSPFAGLRANWTLRAAGLDADAADAGERGVAHRLVLDVGQRLGRGDGDRVAGVHAHRVEVLDRADDHAVVGPVAHDLELVLLPAGDRLLDEDLADRAGVEAVGGEPLELLGGRGDAGALAAEDVGRADDDGQADALERPRGPRPGRVRDARGRARRGRSPVIASLNCSRSSAVAMASALAPISSTPCASSTPASTSSIARLSAVWPPSVGSSASGRSRSMIAVEDRRRRAARRRWRRRSRGRS